MAGFETSGRKFPFVRTQPSGKNVPTFGSTAQADAPGAKELLSGRVARSDQISFAP